MHVRLGSPRKGRPRTHRAEAGKQGAAPRARPLAARPPSVPRGPSGSGEAPLYQNCLVGRPVAACAWVAADADAKQLIEELENDPRLHLKAGNHRQRRSARMSFGKLVAEAYSPPRICARAEARGMDFGSSLDLTTTDEEGRP